MVLADHGATVKTSGGVAGEAAGGGVVLFDTTTALLNAFSAAFFAVLASPVALRPTFP